MFGLKTTAPHLDSTKPGKAQGEHMLSALAKGGHPTADWQVASAL